MNTIHKHFQKIAVICSVVVALGGAAICSGQTYQLSFKPKPGVTRYEMNMNIQTKAGSVQGQSVPAMHMVMGMIMSMNAKDLGGGKHLIKMTTKVEKSLLNGTSQKVPNMQDTQVTMTVDSKGKVLSTQSSSSAPGVGEMMKSFANPGLFARPLTVGQTFTATSNAMGMAAESVYRFERVQTVGGRKLGYFTVESVKSSSIQMKFVGKPETTIDLSTGMLVSMNMKIVIAIGGVESETDVSMRELH